MRTKFKQGDYVTVQPITNEFEKKTEWHGRVLSVQESFLVSTPAAYFVVPEGTPDIAHRVDESRLAPHSGMRVYESLLP